jgi:hypothetical protein
MKRLLAGAVFGVVLAGCTGWGQMHKVAKPEQVVRAVGVYEWTGDLAKPTASRLVPVSLYIEGKLEDAGVYVARPVPFALLQGNVYELQDAGVSKGTLELAYAKHVQTQDASYDDGWFGFGTFRAPVAAKKAAPLRASKTLPVITTSSDSSKPHLSSKGGDAGGDADKSGGSSQTADPDRPTMKRRTSDSGSDSGSGSSGTAGGSSGQQSAGSTPSDGPDRPTMKRKPSTDSGSGSGDTTASSGSGSGSGSDSTPANDPDRPTLKRHSAEDAKKARENDVASVTGPSTSLNDDPDRPNLHHGKPTSAMTEADLPKLVGLPPEAHQMVAVSDAVNREPHPFTLAWTDEAERAAVLAKLQGMARAQLAAYGGAPAPAATAAPAVKKTPATPATASKTRRAGAPAGAPAEPLLGEDLKAYTLSYGGAATYVYMAHTAGTGAGLRYVTVVAQADALGEVKPALQNVTDAAHLGRTPRMRFVDVVDAEASNRASLLFEMREQSSRQFALYRVIATKAELVFLTGTTQ